MGPKNLEKYIVATRHVVNQPAWPENDKKIKQARLDYDSGLTEMCQGRDGDMIILYSIPRKNPELDRRPWFDDCDNDNVIDMKKGKKQNG